MPSSEPTTVSSAADIDEGAPPERHATGELRVTTELPPSSESKHVTKEAAKRRSRRRERGKGDKRESNERDRPGDRKPVFAPARRPGRRVIRIVRHVQLWSVFKVALLGGLVFYTVFLIATGIAWSLANTTGQVHHIEQFMRQIGFDNWSFDGARLFRAAALIGAILLVVGSILTTLTAAIVNLIAEATGGIRFTVIETDESDDDEDEDEPR